jgi:hypothetical protein
MLQPYPLTTELSNKANSYFIVVCNTWMLSQLKLADFKDEAPSKNVQTQK